MSETPDPTVADEKPSGAISPSDSDDNDESPPPVPALAVTRSRRGNAGNRMAQLIRLAAAEDDAMKTAHAPNDSESYEAALFREAADDVEFQGQDLDEEDVFLSSSSASEDEAAQGDSDASDNGDDADHRSGRRLHVATTHRLGKRKNENLLQKTMRLKKMKYDPLVTPSANAAAAAASSSSSASPLSTASASPRPAPVSSSSASSPIATPTQPKPYRYQLSLDPTRASTRKLAMANRVATHERLKESERKREKILRDMRAAEDRKKHTKAKPLTQEERLSQAATIEKQNSKSLSHWEEAEKRRQNEQMLKLESLHNRQLQGPVIRFWTGPSMWAGGKLKQVGRTPLDAHITKSEIPAPPPTTSTFNIDPAPLVQPPSEPPLTVQTPLEEDATALPIVGGGLSPSLDALTKSPQLNSSTVSISHSTTFPTKHSALLDGIEQYASLPPTPTATHPLAVQQVFDTPTHRTLDPNLQLESHQVPPFHAILSLPKVAHYSTPTSESSWELAVRSLISLSNFPTLNRTGAKSVASPIQDSQPYNTRRAHEKDQLVLLRTLFSIPPYSTTHPADPPVDLEEPQSSDYYWPSFYQNGLPQQPAFEAYDPSVAAAGGPRHSTRYLSKRAVACSLTGMVAKYRDPETGLAYANASAFKMLREVGSGRRGTWSGLLQAWIGESTPAMGVPMDVWEGRVKLKANTAASTLAPPSENKEASKPESDIVELEPV